MGSRDPGPEGSKEPDPRDKEPESGGRREPDPGGKEPDLACSRKPNPGGSREPDPGGKEPDPADRLVQYWSRHASVPILRRRKVVLLVTLLLARRPGRRRRRGDDDLMDILHSMMERDSELLDSSPGAHVAGARCRCYGADGRHPH